MSTKLDSLLIDFEVRNGKLIAGVDQAESKINSFANKTKANLDKLAAVWAATFAIRGIVDTITQFEKLEASLRTVTGSAELAAERFAALQEFAATTPFQLTEVVDAFIKLKALGLTPSEEALHSFGNTAVAMGKSLNQFIEAVADATTGEFERLKEFGIKAKSQGDEVSFTFQGVTQTIGKNSVEIEKYLRSIGNVQFAGAMEEQANTLNVSLSNLEDAFDKLVKAIGDAGLTDLFIFIADTLKGVIEIAQQSVKGFRVMGLSVLEFGANINSVILDLLGFKDAANKARQDARAFVEEIGKLNQSGSLPEDSSGSIIPSPVPDAEKMAEDLDRFRESLMTASELEQASFEERLAQIEEFRNNQLVTEQEYNDLLEKEQERHRLEVSKLEKDGYAERIKFDKASNKDKAKTIFGELDNITSGVAQHNKGLFEINKVAGIANAIINAYEGISLTMAKYPYPINIGMAAAHAAAAFAQVSAIRATQFNGGGAGAAPSVAGSTAATPVSDVSGGGSASSSLDVRLSGISADSFFSGSQVKALINKINEAIEDGAIIKSVSVAS